MPKSISHEPKRMPFSLGDCAIGVTRSSPACLPCVHGSLAPKPDNVRYDRVSRYLKTLGFAYWLWIRARKASNRSPLTFSWEHDHGHRRWLVDVLVPRGVGNSLRVKNTPALVCLDLKPYRANAAIASRFNEFSSVVKFTAPLERVPPTWRIKLLSRRRVGPE